MPRSKAVAQWGFNSGILLLAALVPVAALAQQEATLQAEVQRQLGEGHIMAEGYVDLRSDDVKLTADRVEFWRDEMRVVAEGNVVYEQGDQKIIATRLEADLNTKTGRFFNAHGMAGADFYFYGDIIEKLSEDTYSVEGGAFTSCAQPVPRWRFTAGKAIIKRDHHVRLHNTLLRVKFMPVFYLPIMYYPIDEDERSTGFLFPQIGNSSIKGFLFNQGFFWAINRSMDATFSYERFSLIGNGGSAEYRYVASDASRGEVNTFYLNDTTNGSREYTIRAFANQNLPGGFTSVTRVDYFSSFDFQQRFQEDYNRATQRSKRATATIAKSMSGYTLRILLDRNDTSFGDSVAIRKLLPKVTFGSRPSRMGGTPILFSFDSEMTTMGRTNRDDVFEYSRFDVVPTVSYPFTGLSFLTFRTSVTGRYTYYTSSLAGRDLVDENIDRRYYETSFDMRGPTFAKIFNTPNSGYSTRIKHIIEPQMVWSYRSRVENFDDIPKFDGDDYVPGTNQVSFSLVNRFLAKRRVNGREQQTPTEMLSWVISQRYFFDANASLYDSQFSTPYYTEDGTPSNYSPITSRVRFRPAPALSVSWNVDYDLNFHAVRSSSLAGTTSGRWGMVTGNWTRRNIPDRDVIRSNLRAATRINITSGLQASFDTSYDYTNKRLQAMRAGVNYNVQCCGFQFEYNRWSFGNFRDENTFRFGISLANIGTFGTSLGGGATQTY